MNILQRTRVLIDSQLQGWPLAASNYAGLAKVRTRSVVLSGGSEVKVQFNPERIRSSAAKVDAKSINERPCFLCEKNRPGEQQGVGVGDYTILVNPFPIFPQHLTVPHNDHTLQLIAPYFRSMLELSSELSDFTLFYNGPKCGASAPDHFHFQAGIKGFMPVETDFKSGKYTRKVGDFEGCVIYNWEGYNRGVITIKGSEVEAIVSRFNALHKMLWAQQPGEVEPMLNVLAYYENEQYVVHVYPRILHRPACYFKEGSGQILISPASVDMGGVFITPRLEDFEKISPEDIEGILNEVCLDEKSSRSLAEQLLIKS